MNFGPAELADMSALDNVQIVPYLFKMLPWRLTKAALIFDIVYQSAM